MKHALLALVTFAAVLAAAPPAAGTDLGPARFDPRPALDPAALGQPMPASALRPLSDCSAFRAYATEVVVDALVRSLYFWSAYPWAGPGGGDGGNGGGPSDYTSTNNQETGVDELDLVKTDGLHIFTTGDDSRLSILRSWPPESTAMVASLELEGWPYGLLRSGSWLLVATATVDDLGFAPQSVSVTRLDLVDVADPSAPRVRRTIEVEGVLVGARMIDGEVYAVVWSYLEIPQAAWDLISRDDLGLPEFDWDATEEEREAAAAAAREILHPLVTDIVAGLEMTELAPLVRDRSASRPDAPAEPLLACEDMMRPAEVSSWAALSVLHLDLGTNDPIETPLDTVGILADGFTLYASAHSLYVAQSSWWWWWGWGELEQETTIHRFALGGEERPVTYAASGEVPGWLLSQMSMGEHDGHLRVATTEIDWWWGSSDDRDAGSIVSVLEDGGDGRLHTVGRVDGIAPGEQIQACRFLGERGYLVTFLQVDPLFTLDLSDPTDPRVVGELEMPGFSAYLHPMDATHLLAVGMHGDTEGNLDGLAVNIFDVADPSQPVLAHQLVLPGGENGWTWSDALADHHAFTFHRGVLSLPYYQSTADTYSSGLLVLAAAADAGIAELGRVDHSDLPPPPGSWWGTLAWMRRSLYIEDNLYSLSSSGLKVSLLEHPWVTLASVPFYPAAP